MFEGGPQFIITIHSSKSNLEECETIAWSDWTVSPKPRLGGKAAHVIITYPTMFLYAFL